MKIVAFTEPEAAHDTMVEGAAASEDAGPLDVFGERSPNYFVLAGIGLSIGFAAAALVWPHDHALALAFPLLWIAGVIDARTEILPDVLTLPAIGIAAFVVANGGPSANAALLGLAAVLVVGVAWHAIRPEGIGLGDVKLLAAIGIGGGVEIVGYTVALSGIMVVVVAAGGLLLGRGFPRRVPWGPYLLAAATVLGATASSP
jgi:leader peptidase (prepilin peptidase)/N-methyltransferase